MEKEEISKDHKTNEQFQGKILNDLKLLKSYLNDENHIEKGLYFNQFFSNFICNLPEKSELEKFDKLFKKDLEINEELLNHFKNKKEENKKKLKKSKYLGKKRKLLDSDKINPKRRTKKNQLKRDIMSSDEEEDDEDDEDYTLSPVKSTSSIDDYKENIKNTKKKDNRSNARKESNKPNSIQSKLKGKSTKKKISGKKIKSLDSDEKIGKVKEDIKPDVMKTEIIKNDKPDNLAIPESKPSPPINSTGENPPSSIKNNIKLTKRSHLKNKNYKSEKLKYLQSTTIEYDGSQTKSNYLASKKKEGMAIKEEIKNQSNNESDEENNKRPDKKPYKGEYYVKSSNEIYTELPREDFLYLLQHAKRFDK
jgi:hypothetical protein